MLPQIVLGSLGSVSEFLSPFVGNLPFISSVSSCPPLPKGDLVYDVYMGYPESFMWDKKRCVAYFSNLYNASLSIYDPYQPKVLKTFQFPGLSHAGDSANPNPLHTSGLVLRPTAENPTHLEFLIDNGDAFFTEGANLTGPDYIMTMDLNTHKVVDQTHLNLGLNGQQAGYADLEPGHDGNTYVLGTYPANVLRVTPDRKVSTFYVEKPLDAPKTYGFTGIAHANDTLIVNNNVLQQFVRLDLNDEEGTPVVIPQTPYHGFTTSNMLNLPERYNDTIMLATENTNAESVTGGVGVFRSKDKKWREMEFLGFIPSRLELALATATRQMADRLYMVSLYLDGDNITVSGHSSKFVLQDVTDEIDALVYA